MKKQLNMLLVLLGLLAIFSCSKQKDDVPKNDLQLQSASAAFWNLTGNIVVHDPCIIRGDNMWWVFATGTGVGVKYSSDGRNWTQGTQVFQKELSWWRQYAPNMGSNDVWAPDIFYYNGRYWLYYSISSFGSNNSAIGLYSCSSILKGDWRDDGLVIASKNTNYNAIDANITLDPKTNRLWMSFGSWFDGIKLVEINKSTMKPTGSIYTLARRSGGIEASDIVYNGGYYYLFVSIDKCCNGVNSTYKIAYGRATSITGPYKDQSGYNMLNGAAWWFDTGNDRWKGPGGQDIYNGIIVRHAYDATDNGTPKMLINDLYFSNGWPKY